MPGETILKNQFLTARLDSTTGALLGIDSPDGRTLVTGAYCSFKVGTKQFSENPKVAEAERFQIKEVRALTEGMQSVIATPDVEILRRFTLPANSPLLVVRYEVRALNTAAELAHPVALPELFFAADFLDHMEDDEDLYSDGAELHDGRELPPWRVFFREGRRDGLLAATRSKTEMSHFQIFERSFAIKPHLPCAYSTNFIMAFSPLTFKEKTAYAAEFEIGPWQKDAHEALLRASCLDVPQARRNPPITGTRPAPKDGIIFRAADFAGKAAISAEYHPTKWMLLDLPNCTPGASLVAGSEVYPPKIKLNPKLAGVYRVYAGIGNGAGVVAKFSKDKMPTIRFPKENVDTDNPFVLRLSGPQPSREVLIKTAQMDGQKIEFSRYPNSYAVTVLNYVRFEKLSDAEIAAWQDVNNREPLVELSGLNDIPDIAQFTDAHDPDPATYEANLWEHANSKVRKVYWRVDGQCSDYPSKLNTMRYTSARVHGVFTPQAKSYGRVLKKTDMLKLAVKASRRYGLKLYGWMRFNSYMGNVQSDFFKQHPQFHEANDRGLPLKKLCMAFPEARQHKIDILCEAVGYGLDGVNLGFLRHAPVLHYAPVLVEGFKKQFGVPPPPEPAKEVADHVTTHPEEDDLRLKWYAYRAQFLTQFGRELRAAFKAKRLKRAKIAIWVMPDRCLYHGIDIDAWLNEGLCDEIVISHPSSIDFVVPPEFKQKVKGRVPLIYGITGFYPDPARKEAMHALKEGYDGICTYESDYSVLQDSFVELYRDLRKSETAK